MGWQNEVHVKFQQIYLLLLGCFVLLCVLFYQMYGCVVNFNLFLWTCNSTKSWEESQKKRIANDNKKCINKMQLLWFVGLALCIIYIYAYTFVCLCIIQIKLFPFSIRTHKLFGPNVWRSCGKIPRNFDFISLVFYIQNNRVRRHLISIIF